MNKIIKTEERGHWVELATQIFSEMRRSRFYALTPDAQRSLGALAAAWREAGNSFSNSDPDNGREKFAKWLQFEVGPLVNGLFQEQPSDPSELPKVWRDPVTNEPLPNPWLTRDARGRLTLSKRDPALAAHFQAMANPKSSPYEYVASPSRQRGSSGTSESHKVRRRNP
jgi:hypothetical protein